LKIILWRRQYDDKITMFSFAAFWTFAKNRRYLENSQVRTKVTHREFACNNPNRESHNWKVYRHLTYWHDALPTYPVPRYL
jgi:hypothetical protein